MYYTVLSAMCSLALIQPRKIILFEHGPDALRQMLCEAVVPAEYSGGIIYRQGEPGRSWPMTKNSQADECSCPGDWMVIVLSGLLEKSILQHPSSPELPIGFLVM